MYLRFGAATHRAAVYVNGRKITEHEGGFLPFCADITGAVHYDADNKVVVKVNNELAVTNIPCGETFTLPDGRKMNKPYFDFYCCFRYFHCLHHFRRFHLLDYFHYSYYFRFVYSRPYFLAFCGTVFHLHSNTIVL